MKTTANLRVLAAQIVNQVVEQGQSLTTLLPASQRLLADKDRGLLQELCFGVLRTLPQLEWFAGKLMARPLTGKLRPLHYLILLGLYQLLYTRIAPHAAVSETVNAALALRYASFKALINGVLRQFQRQQADLQQQAQQQSPQQPCQHLHPPWLVRRLQQAYPQQWQQIIQANNQRPPMWLRINQQRIQPDQWLQQWRQTGGDAYTHDHCPAALRLQTPLPTEKLPGFADGLVTVQDVSAQRCALLLAPQNGEHIVDLCAAPGGKTTHILELAPQAQLLAVDLSAQRLERVAENLQRMQMQAQLKVADGRDCAQWAENRQFDRILLDAPCSATGVIRRHPDIKWLRRDDDIAPLAALQAALLQAAWSRLKPGGTLLYATCSLLPEENQQQISAFLAATSDARLALPTEQLLPGEHQGDGFFYARLSKG